MKNILSEIWGDEMNKVRQFHVGNVLKKEKEKLDTKKLKKGK